MKFLDRSILSINVLTGLITALLLLVNSVVFADVTPQSIAFNCRNCHGQQSGEVQPASLEQLSAMEIRTLLLAFKYDKQTATLMPRIAKGYTDAELSAVADFLGKP
jgi:cytochrome subunit of sulfide dehydrogenase